MENSISILIKTVNNNFERIMNNSISELDLTSTQCNVLGFLFSHNEDEINPSDVEKHCHLKKPTVSGILKRLYEKGFIELAPSHKDNRYKQIVLTEKVFNLKEEMNKRFKTTEEILCRNISEEEKNMTISVLKRMFNNLQNHN